MRNQWLAALLLLAGGALARPSAPAAPAIPADLQRLITARKVVEVANSPDLKRAAEGAPLSGKISTAKVYRVADRAGIAIYRVYGNKGCAGGVATGGNQAVGGWWALSPPPAGTSKKKYGTDYEICPEWNTLGQMATCTLKAGSMFAIGPGQSVGSNTCPSLGAKTLPANPRDWQVYIHEPWTKMYRMIGTAKLMMQNNEATPAGLVIMNECTPRDRLVGPAAFKGGIKCTAFGPARLSGTWTAAQAP